MAQVMRTKAVQHGLQMTNPNAAQSVLRPLCLLWRPPAYKPTLVRQPKLAKDSR